METLKPIKAFYFSTDDRKLRYGDDREIVVGETHTVEGKIKAGKNGLHASKKLTDAIKYAPGNILYLVELSGDIDLSNDDKVAARNRKYLAEFDATEVLKEFASKQALINIEKIKPYCSEEEYNLIVEFLETGDESLRKHVWWALSSIITNDNADDNAARHAVDAINSTIRSYTSPRHLTYWVHSVILYASWAANVQGDNYFKNLKQFRSKQNQMLIDMIQEATDGAFDCL